MKPSAFLNAYRDTWSRVITGGGTVDEFDEFFDLPCLMVLTDGTVLNVTTPEALRAFNDERRDSFQGADAAVASLDDIVITDSGGHTAFTSVRWHLHRLDGSLERVWRHAYTLRRTDDGWRILVSAFQSGA